MGCVLSPFISSNRFSSHQLLIWWHFADETRGQQSLCYLAAGETDGQWSSRKSKNQSRDHLVSCGQLTNNPPASYNSSLFIKSVIKVFTPHCYSHLQLYHLIMSIFATGGACSVPDGCITSHLIIARLNFLSLVVKPQSKERLFWHTKDYQVEKIRDQAFLLRCPSQQK